MFKVERDGALFITRYIELEFIKFEERERRQEPI